MSEGKRYVIAHDNPRWRDVVEHCVSELRKFAESRDVSVVIGPLLRTLDQNAAMWPALTDFARDVEWFVTNRLTGEVRRCNAEAMKHVLTGTFCNELWMAEGLNGEAVVFPARTSKFSRKRMGEFLSFVYAEGTARGVNWSRDSRKTFDAYGVK